MSRRARPRLKHVRELSRRLRPAGLRIEHGSKKPRIVDASTGRFVTSMPLTPDDSYLWEKKLLAQLRRQGYRVT